MCAAKRERAEDEKGDQNIDQSSRVELRGHQDGTTEPGGHVDTVNHD